MAKHTDADGEPIRGARTINEAEAESSAFRAFAAGISHPMRKRHWRRGGAGLWKLLPSVDDAQDFDPIYPNAVDDNARGWRG